MDNGLREKQSYFSFRNFTNVYEGDGVGRTLEPVGKRSTSNNLTTTPPRQRRKNELNKTELKEAH